MIFNPGAIHNYEDFYLLPLVGSNGSLFHVLHLGCHHHHKDEHIHREPPDIGDILRLLTFYSIFSN